MSTFIINTNQEYYTSISQVDMRHFNTRKLELSYSPMEESWGSLSTQCNTEVSEAPLSPLQLPSPYPESILQKERKGNGSIQTESFDYSAEEYEEEEFNVYLDERQEVSLKKLAVKCKYDWKKVARKFNNSYKTKLAPSELRYKYKNLHKPNMTLRVKFTHEEDLMIAKYFDQFGSDWIQIASYFPTRTAVMLKNRFYSYIRKNDLLSDMIKEAVSSEKQSEEESPEVAEEIKFEEPQQENIIPLKDRIKNLFEDNAYLHFNIPRFDMDTCLLTGLHTKITTMRW